MSSVLIRGVIGEAMDVCIWSAGGRCNFRGEEYLIRDIAGGNLLRGGKALRGSGTGDIIWIGLLVIL